MIWAVGGFFAEASDWNFLKPYLPTKSFRTPDLWQRNSTSLSLADWARNFCDEVRAQDSDATLLGYSLGGRLAAHALLQSGHPFRRAILVSTHFGLSDEAEKEARRLNDEKWARALLHEPWSELLKAWNSQPVFSDELSPFAREEINFSRAALAEAMLNWSLARQDYLLPRLHEIKIPVTLVAGEKDGRFREQAERAHGQISSSRLTVISGQGHRLLWTQKPESIASLLIPGSPLPR